MSNMTINNLQDVSHRLRLDVMNMVYEAKDGHPGPAFSIADLITVLYFKEMRIDPKNPSWEDRDRFVLSKGHACTVLYAALARKGYFSVDELHGLRKYGSILQGHPDMNKTPGIDITSGSLGNGLGMAVGMALAARYQQKDFYTYAVIGDGECEEGLIWESAMAASKYKLNHLIAFLDHNGWQSGGSIQDISGLESVINKWESFNWNCQIIPGHDFDEIINAITKAKLCKDKPSMIIMNTIKGKGLPFMENDNSWHKRVPTEEQMKEAIKILGDD
ncbi:transketolase [Pectinatus haikarae]|uniref:Transketolase n=1 Tax=Pectinatus haikarae TaxID=349096 RepID=A0ABT9Y952_9FIRM|nr:transketolase [Pectinatus haikarae]MDQ0204382.1 transketolase [Pectinatus haikarae]